MEEGGSLDLLVSLLTISISDLTISISDLTVPYQWPISGLSVMYVFLFIYSYIQMYIYIYVHICPYIYIYTCVLFFCAPYIQGETYPTKEKLYMCSFIPQGETNPATTAHRHCHSHLLLRFPSLPPTIPPTPRSPISTVGPSPLGLWWWTH